MTTFELIFAVILTATAVSYGWGMRGCVIGGEKGAMLPGALLGLFLAKLSGIPIIEDNAFAFSVVGCFAMGYGGFEPYAQTMEMVIKPQSDIYNPKRGYTGLMLKGANWFGICGVLLGIGFTAMTGTVYTLPEIAAITLLIPFVQVLGIRIFNKPYDRAKSIFPKIYFSRDRREEWGGNLLTLIGLLLVTALKGDTFAFFFGVSGIAAGAVGWAISIWIYSVTLHPRKNGKFIFGKAQKNGYIDNWKIMEFSFGLLGGGGLSVYFFLKIDTVRCYAEKIFENGMWNPLGERQDAIAWLVFTVAVLMAVQYFFKGLQKSRLFELAERAVYFSFPLCLVLLGSARMVSLTVFLLMLWVLTEKTVFDREAEKLPKLIKAEYLIAFAAALICDAIYGVNSSVYVILLMYTFYYILADVICTVLRPIRGNEKTSYDKFKGCILTYIWFALLSIIIVAAARFAF